MGGDYLKKYQPLVAGRGCSLADIRVQKSNFAFLFSGGLKKRRIHP